MNQQAKRKGGALVDDYCSQLGLLIERRTTELALVASKEQAEHAAVLAREAMLQAQQADRAKTQFLANMTHELRTPLNAIIGFSELIHTAPQQSDTPDHARYIRDAGARLLGIVNGVLDLARLDAGKLTIDDQPVSIDELFQLTLRPMRPLAAKKAISIACAGDGARTVQVDPAKLAQALGNLLSNAIQFTPEGGAIEVASGISPSGDLVISVRDNGPGIPAEDIERVLQPFGQVEDHLTRESAGIGLGLPIARALVKLHGGELSIASELGLGMTAEITLPAARIDSAPPGGG